MQFPALPQDGFLFPYLLPSPTFSLMEPALYIVGTPIGNLSDLSARAIETLQQVDLICAEDTRHTQRLTQRHDIQTPLTSYHKFNEAQRTQSLVQRIQEGQAIALVSDSGMPTISDPGVRLIQACREAQLTITPIPGPTALATALACSGLPHTGFTFIGFLPPKSGGRQRELTRWADHSLPVILYESPHRLLKLMTEIEQHLGPDRRLFIARELTKKHEELLEGSPDEITATFENRTVKGELVVILHPLTIPSANAKQSR